ncbi:hypothetical protein C8Q76DRAFT_790980 [Earliella scabrosa]|nr:hypothetical protein C8Q76DRAFT_790980 [Earliella scabrosa]
MHAISRQCQPPEWRGMPIHFLHDRLMEKSNHSKKEDALYKTATAMVREYEEQTKRCNTDLDYFLTYSGIFSSILASFTLQSYPLLLPSISDLSPSAEPSTTNIVLNTLWFSALICSLAATTFGVIIKQWLYDNHRSGSWRKRTTDEHYARWLVFRSHSIDEWHVELIIDMLFYLFQLSFVLFFVGLFLLLWTIHKVVAIVATVLISVVLALMMASYLIPVFDSTCYYVSPLTHVFYVLKELLRHSFGWMRQHLSFFGCGPPASGNPHSMMRWEKRQQKLLKDNEKKLTVKLIVATVLGYTASKSQDEADLKAIPRGDTVLHLMKGLEPEHIRTCFKKIHEAAWHYGTYGGSNIPMDFWQACLLNLLRQWHDLHESDSHDSTGRGQEPVSEADSDLEEDTSLR